MMQDLYCCGMTFLSEQRQYTSFRILPVSARCNSLAAQSSFLGGYEEKHLDRLLTVYLTHCNVANIIPFREKQIEKSMIMWMYYPILKEHIAF